MLGKLADQNDIYIDWDDERLYGGTEEFAEQEWVPVPGYEVSLLEPSRHRQEAICLWLTTP
jgi:hypothetical protein